MTQGKEIKRTCQYKAEHGDLRPIWLVKSEFLVCASDLGHNPLQDFFVEHGVRVEKHTPEEMKNYKWFNTVMQHEAEMAHPGWRPHSHACACMGPAPDGSTGSLCRCAYNYFAMHQVAKSRIVRLLRRKP